MTNRHVMDRRVNQRRLPNRVLDVLALHVLAQIHVLWLIVVVGTCRARGATSRSFRTSFLKSRPIGQGQGLQPTDRSRRFVRSRFTFLDRRLEVDIRILFPVSRDPVGIS